MLLFLLLLCALCAALQWWTLGHALDGVSHTCTTDRAVVEPDEPFAFVTCISNASRRFVPFVRVEEDLPDGLTFADASVRVHRPVTGGSKLPSTVYLLPRQSWTRRLTASLPARGRYVLRGARLSGGDFLGLSETAASFPQTREIVARPRPWTGRPQITALGGFLGEVSVNRFLFEDPVLTLGYREYTGREPQKSISWPQSARLGRLMVKNYDHTLDLSVSVLLCVEQPEGWDAVPSSRAQRGDPLSAPPEPAASAQPGDSLSAPFGRLEACFSLARTVCETLEERRIGARFFTNARAAGAPSLWSRVGDGLGQGHLNTILEGLGRATYDPGQPFARVCAQAARAAEPGRCHVLIAPVLTDALRAQAQMLRTRTGGAVLVLTPDGEVRL